MIKFIDIISMAGIKLYDYKIHCATSKTWSPLEEFFDGRFRQWQEQQNQKNFQCKHILSMIHLENNRWLFAGVYKVKGVKPYQRKGKIRFLYSTQEVKGLDHLTGRAIIQFEKNFRASYLRGHKYEDQLILAELRDQRMTIGDFPGYNSVLLSYRMLKTIVRESNPSWKAALSNVAGVYLVTDTTSGKMYVGSAYGGDGIWQRWTAYSKNGHGGNKELRVLLHKKGENHAEHFQFSLLEICDLNSSDEYVIDREVYWKKALKTREFGLNQN
jgi:hypothetical protein